VTFREVAAEAGVPVRVVQSYAGTEDQLAVRSLGHLAARLDARISHRAAERGHPLTRRQAVEIVLTSALPLDAESRADALARTAAYAVALTDPALRAAGIAAPQALVRHLTGLLDGARDTGELRPGLDPTTEAPLLLALTSGLTSAVLGGMHAPADAVALLEHHLDRLFTDPRTKGAVSGRGG
jgi:AcrR family transcriptional regulator